MEVNDVVECIIPPNHLSEIICKKAIITIIIGEGIAICNGIEEKLKHWVYHVCPKGSTHP